MQTLLKLLKSQDGVFKINALKLTYAIRSQEGKCERASSAAIGGFPPWVLVAWETLSPEITTSGVLMIDVPLYILYIIL